MQVPQSAEPPEVIERAYDHLPCMLAHPSQYTAIGVFAIVFSAGGGTSATITTDGGRFARLSRACLAKPAPRSN